MTDQDMKDMKDMEAEGRELRNSELKMLRKLVAEDTEASFAPTMEELIKELKRHREAVEVYQDCLSIIKNSIDPVTNEHIDEQEEADEALKRGDDILKGH